MVTSTCFDYLENIENFTNSTYVFPMRAKVVNSVVNEIRISFMKRSVIRRPKPPYTIPNDIYHFYEDIDLTYKIGWLF